MTEILSSHPKSTWWKDLFSLDVRSLALFRVALALLILADLCFRSSDLLTFYTDLGVMPRAFLSEMRPDNYMTLAPHFWGGSPLFEGILFLVAAFFAIGLLFGYRTTFVTVISWLFMISLHKRNFLVLQGGDVLFRLLVFWAIFLPLGALLSLDNWKKPLKSHRVISVATAAFIIQLCLIYWSSVLFKWNVDWISGKAAFFALHIDQFTTPLGHWIREIKFLSPILTYFTLFMEGIVPFFLFIPWKQGPIRTLVVLLFILLHASFALTMELGLFPWICITAWLPLLPTWFWEKILPKKSLIDNAPISYASKVENGIVATIIASVCMMNWSTTHPNWQSPELGRPLLEIAETLQLGQRWNMFSRPLRNDGWYVIEGKLLNGDSVDLFRNGAPLTFEKPKLVSALYPNQRWRKYMMNLWSKRFADYRKPLAKYLCQKWNSTHSGLQRLHTINIIYVLEKTLEDFSIKPAKKLRLYSHKCPPTLKETKSSL